MMRKVYLYYPVTPYLSWKKKMISFFHIVVVELPWIIRRCLKWKLSTITPVVVRKTVVNSGFRVIKEPKDWVGTWGKHMKSPLFTSILEHQKVKLIPKLNYLTWLMSFSPCTRSIIFPVHFKSEGKTDCGETCKKWLPNMDRKSRFFFF